MKNTDKKYSTISQAIIEMITSGKLVPGNRVPSEHELMEKYKVSNTTARKSLLYLELNGWVIRIKGKGTFVLNRSVNMHLTRVLGSLDAIRESFEENLVQEGFVPKNILLEKTILDNGISTNVNGRIYSIEGRVLKYHRLRYANNILMKDDTRFISLNACKDINLIEINQPLVRLYEEKYNLKLDNVHRSIGTDILWPGDQENYFNNDKPLSAFILNGVCIAEDDVVVEIEHSIYRGDKYSFYVNATPKLTNAEKKLSK